MKTTGNGHQNVRSSEVARLPGSRIGYSVSRYGCNWAARTFRGGYSKDLDCIFAFQPCFTLLAHYQDTRCAHRNPSGRRWSIQNILLFECSFFLLEDVETEVLSTVPTSR